MVPHHEASVRVGRHEDDAKRTRVGAPLGEALQQEQQLPVSLGDDIDVVEHQRRRTAMARHELTCCFQEHMVEVVPDRRERDASRRRHDHSLRLTRSESNPMAAATSTADVATSRSAT